MPTATFTFNEPVNSGLQIGDIVYYVNTNTVPNSIIPHAITSNVTKFGIVNEIGPTPGNPNNYIKAVYDSATVSLPPSNAYIMFEKDKQVNSSSLIGYYADIELKNHSDGKIEMFSLAAGVSENSK